MHAASRDPAGTVAGLEARPQGTGAGGAGAHEAAPSPAAGEVAEIQTEPGRVVE